MYKEFEKHVLVISNNPLSRIQHNGKTIVSLLNGLDDNNIYQLYLNEESPDYSDLCHYYHISEKQIIRSILHLAKCGKEISPVEKKALYNYKVGSKLKKSALIRLMREAIWKTNCWKTRDLCEWIKKAKIDSILFVAGDSVFAYEICKYVKAQTNARLSVFITDDYILRRSNESFIQKTRRLIIKKSITDILEQTDVFFTISDQMKNTYKKIFGVDSFVIRNYSRIEQKQRYSVISSNIKIVYAGGLHYNRWKVLKLLVSVLEHINKCHPSIQVHLDIYSSQVISEEIYKSITRQNVSTFCGGVNEEELNIVLNRADILLFVESFDKSSIESTKLSFSTKIPEYLSTGKCLLAVGPSSVASMKYLNDCAYCINKPKQMGVLIERLLLSNELMSDIGDKCYRKFISDFSEKNQKNALKNILG